MSLGGRPIKCFRPSGAYDAEGRWEEATDPKPFWIEASVQPLTPRDMEKLPEGRRTRAAYRLYTDFKLRALDDSGAKNPDRVWIDKQIFEVISNEAWENGIVPHNKAVVSLLDQPPDGE
jgi:hypothetical protein